MSVNYLLKIDGAQIKGESSVIGYTDYMEIETFSWGATQTGTFAYGGGGGGGKTNMQDFHFTMKTNKASPKLMEACANGTAVTTATFVSLKAGGKSPVVSIKVVMTDLLISSYQTGGQSGDDDIPSDQISLNFAKVAFTHTPQKKDGSSDASVDGGWDLKKQKSGR